MTDEGMHIRPVVRDDAASWERMRQELWPSDPGEHAGEIARFFEGDRRVAAEVLIAVDTSGRALGFAELAIRPYAEECYSGHVGYLEGWFVHADLRRTGIGAALVRAAEEWARTQGCTEFASDVEIDNAVSLTAHAALGFEEVNRLVCFRKALSGPETRG